MKIIDRSWQIIKNIFFFLLFVVLLAVSVYGTNTPGQIPHINLNNWQLSTFEAGIYLFQPTQKYFYNISPLNDFYVNQNNLRIALLSNEDFSQKNYTTNLVQSHFNQLTAVWQNYFTNPAVSYKYQGQNSASYLVTPTQNQLLFTRQITLGEEKEIISLGSTLSFYPADFIFSPEGSLFTNQNEENIALFEETFQFDLDSNYADRQQIQNNQLLLYNPHLTGFLLIQAPEKSFLWVDNENQLLEIYYPVDENLVQTQSPYVTQFQITILDSLEDL